MPEVLTNMPWPFALCMLAAVLYLSFELMLNGPRALWRFVTGAPEPRKKICFPPPLLEKHIPSRKEYRAMEAVVRERVALLRSAPDRDEFAAEENFEDALV